MSAIRSMVITEKPSQMRSVVKAIGSRFGPVLAARGHLLQLKEPEDVNPAWDKWNCDVLYPGRLYDKKPIARTKGVLAQIGAELKQCGRVIIATDPDREGLVIGREIIDFFRFSGEVLRANILADDPVSIRQAFDNLRPFSEFQRLYDSGRAREQADQIGNLTLTRIVTVTMQAPGLSGPIGVGRCKTPVLALVCRRELEIENHVPVTSFEVEGDVPAAGQTLTLVCKRSPATPDDGGDEPQEDAQEELNPGEEALEEAESTVGRILDRTLAERLRQAAERHQGPVQVVAKSGHQAPPRLFDLTSLQAAASARFGWSGEKTLEIAQALYSEHTLITYPRSEFQWLPESAVAEIALILPKLLELAPYQKFSELLAAPVVRQGQRGHFCDKCLKDASHYAISVNVNAVGTMRQVLPGLNDDERRLFNLIATRYLAALAPDYKFHSTSISMPVPLDGQLWMFKASGRMPASYGWRAILGFDKKKEAAPLPKIADGSIVRVAAARLRTTQTKPPARYTDGALLRIMKEVYRLVPKDQANYRERLRLVNGIGTPATRDTIISGLLDQGQIVRDGKVLKPTAGGMALYQALAAIAPNTVDVCRTAQWENLWERVVQGAESTESAVDRIVKATTAEAERIKGWDAKPQLMLGKPKLPSEPKKIPVKTIAKAKGLQVPENVFTDFAACSAFLDEHGEKRDPSMPPGAPSAAALEFARKLAAGAGVEIPADALSDRKALTAWIDKVKASAPAQPPTEKALAYAEQLAAEKGVQVPDGAKENGAACSAFIKKLQGGSKKGGGASKGKGKGKGEPKIIKPNAEA